jgi:hypothetical protein
LLSKKANRTKKRFNSGWRMEHVQKREGRNWTKAIAQANERFMEVLSLFWVHQRT